MIGHRLYSYGRWRAFLVVTVLGGTCINHAGKPESVANAAVFDVLIANEFNCTDICK